LLEELNQSVQKDAVKTTVAEFYAILVMFAEGDTWNIPRWMPLRH